MSSRTSRPALRTTRITAVTAVLGALTLAPGSQAETPAADRSGSADPVAGTASPPVVTIYADDHAFEAPATMPSGAVTIRLVNRGQELHHAQLVRFEEGGTLEELNAAMSTGTVPAWAVWVGGPGLVAPGVEATVTLDLRPGTYHWLCFIESPDDRMPHLAKGMVSTVTVEEAAEEDLPAADNTLMLNDYDFKFGRPLHAGRQVLRVRNYAAQPHEIQLVKLMPGKSMDDVMAWMAGGEQGPPPGMPVGGMQALSQGIAANLELELEPGEYGLVCFIPDVKDFQPHFVHGMVTQITVE